ncbi:MAG TPA: hypothetical protein VJ372_01175, partial [Pyrinomonadaceae bacterium]|nr:hypothetical protein [Pyrinomonadaceae bacterium]
MRQITITAPAGTAQQIAEIAFSSGIARVALSERRILEANGTASVKDCVEIDSSTPAAKAFLDRLT